MAQPPYLEKSVQVMPSPRGHLHINYLAFVSVRNGPKMRLVSIV